MNESELLPQLERLRKLCGDIFSGQPVAFLQAKIETTLNTLDTIISSLGSGEVLRAATDPNKE